MTPGASEGEFLKRCAKPRSLVFLEIGIRRQCVLTDNNANVSAFRSIGDIAAVFPGVLFAQVRNHRSAKGVQA
jgi:hypothetical protein